MVKSIEIYLCKNCHKKVKIDYDRSSKQDVENHHGCPKCGYLRKKK
jgi:DNA-directed RNA polymerase subunit RPC12/RpoP